MPRIRTRYSVVVAVLYFILGILWIFASDQVVGSLEVSRKDWIKIEMVKGWVFIFLSALFIYLVSTSFERQLQNRLHELQRINSDLQAFFYRLSHDLRGPIASILGVVNLAKLDASLLEDPIVVEALERPTKRADQIIKELVRLTHVYDKEVEPEQVELDVLMDQILTTDLPQVEGFSKTVVSQQLNVGKLTSDAHFIRIALLEVLENAVRYHEEGVEEHRVSVEARPRKGAWSITVRDSGIGIRKEHLHLISDLFYRGTPRSTGSGLGLYTARVAAKKVGGSIMVSSRLDVGTEVCLTFPSLRRRPSLV